MYEVWKAECGPYCGIEKDGTPCGGFGIWLTDSLALVEGLVAELNAGHIPGLRHDCWERNEAFLRKYRAQEQAK